MAKTDGQDWSLEEYRVLFSQLNDMAAPGRMSRLMRFEGKTAGNTALRFLGVETEKREIPPGMISLELGENIITVKELKNRKEEITRQNMLKWQWLDWSVGKGVGEFKAQVPSEWTAQKQPVEFILTANAYFEKGKTADDDIKLAGYDPRWPAEYEKMALYLRRILPPEVIVNTFHFGSTAIPGIPAKPVIDIILEVPSLAMARQSLITAFNKPEIEYWMQAMDMCFIVRDRFSGTRTHHIHAAPTNSPYLQQVAFRDYLRAHPDTARSYAALKSELAIRYVNDREGYTNAKAVFIDQVMNKALRLKLD